MAKKKHLNAFEEQKAHTMSGKEADKLEILNINEYIFSKVTDNFVIVKFVGKDRGKSKTSCDLLLNSKRTLTFK